jgi:hypothetical protein
MPKKQFRRWLKLLVAAALVAVGLNLGVSLVMASRRVHAYLTPRFERAFGRKVEVSYYDIRWLPTPGVVAHFVTISEDPRFGQEYFLRAQSVTASPRWRSLLFGKLELGTLELSQPSLNLVRNADGRWNVENWLPVPGQDSPTNSGEPRAPREAARLTRIEIDGGRINFSRGVDRRPFALVDVAGSIEQESAGRWQIELEARPIRATVQLQNTGLLRVTGNISGTTARLQPAMLTLTWSKASLADAFRLAMGYDHGVRGSFDLQLNAWTAKAHEASSPAPARWEFSLGARAVGMHRWDMASRDDNPQVSVRAAGAWQVGTARIDLQRLLVEGPRSNIAGAGTVDWSHGIMPDIRVWSPGVSFVDLVAWHRAFQPGVAEGITANGSIDGFASLHGWPPMPEWGSIDSDGLSLQLPGKVLLQLKTPHISAEKFSIKSASFPLLFLESESSGSSPRFAGEFDTGTDVAVFSFGAGSARPKGQLDANSPWQYTLGLKGSFEHSERLLAAARALGRPLNNNWDAAGRIYGGVSWEWKSGDRFPKPTGRLTLSGIELRFPYLNQPIEIANEEIEFKGSELRIDVKAASALGAKWKGTISRRERRVSKGAPDGSPEWEFDLTADRLDSTELDRWLGPRARPGWLASLFGSPSPQAPQVSSTGPQFPLRAIGNLHLDAFNLGGLEFHKVSARAELDGRQVNFTRIDAKTSGGSVGGSVRASLEADPRYELHVTATKLDAAMLVGRSPSLDGRVAGLISGEARFSLHGIGRENLLRSLEGGGSLSAIRAVVRGLVMNAAGGGTSLTSQDGQFSIISGRFTVAARRIHLEKINLMDAKESYEGNGSVDFARGLLFQFRPVALRGGARSPSGAAGERVIRVMGQLEAPRVTTELLPRATSLPVPQPPTPVTRH